MDGLRRRASADDLVVRAHDVGTPVSRTYTLEFRDDALTLDIAQNVGELPRTHLVSR